LWDIGSEDVLGGVDDDGGITHEDTLRVEDIDIAEIVIGEESDLVAAEINEAEIKSARGGGLVGFMIDSDVPCGDSLHIVDIEIFTGVNSNGNGDGRDGSEVNHLRWKRRRGRGISGVGVQTGCIVKRKPAASKRVGRFLGPGSAVANGLDFLAGIGAALPDAGTFSAGGVPGGWAGEIGFPKWKGSALQRANGINRTSSQWLGNGLVIDRLGGRLLAHEDAVVSAVLGIADFPQTEFVGDFSTVAFDGFFGSQIEKFG
jgi:hypothetical protein